MPTLYTMPGTCALAPNIAIAWLDAPVDVKVMEHGEQKKDEYLAINPKGKVPAVTFEDGDVLTEASAILSWLGAEYGKESYARDTKLGRREAEALSYMTSEVHADYGPHFAAQSFADDKAAQEAVKQKTYGKLAKHYERLEGNLEENGGDHYLGKRSFADAYLYVLTRWIELTPLKIDDYPALAKFRERMQADDGVKKALARQNMEAV
ncbi:Glutathione transferase [Alteripontixanthobacter maritimus]|uniref:Glutathione transferase n=1 Tax=Alteripontixanthobacter maritimus TaxID=2161824 RepID=A0A369Q7D6_9SPHN|nr:glutathione S-transferase [Alteripontixanthobacter maritimus]RDC60382.1 Glutathione transferase [Alteripontixanthobacter maritimus]